MRSALYEQTTACPSYFERGRDAPRPTERNGCFDCIYVSAFPDFATLKQFLTDIAWGTDVWLSDHPDHLIHFNGDPAVDWD